MEDISNNIIYDRLEQGYSNVETVLINLLQDYEETNNFSLNSTLDSSLNSIILSNTNIGLPSLLQSTNELSNDSMDLSNESMDYSGNIPRIYHNTSMPSSLLLPLGNNIGPRRRNLNRFGSLFSSFSNNQNLINIINSTLHDPSQNMYKKVIDDDAEKLIEIIKYKQEAFSDQPTCMMTLNDFKEDDDIAKLPCGHIFNKDCVLKWLKTEDARCPICRNELSSKEIKKKCNENVENVENRNTNRNISTARIFTNLINNELQRQEDMDLEQAILASLRN